MREVSHGLEKRATPVAQDQQNAMVGGDAPGARDCRVDRPRRRRGRARVSEQNDRPRVDPQRDDPIPRARAARQAAAQDNSSDAHVGHVAAGLVQGQKQIRISAREP